MRSAAYTRRQAANLIRQARRATRVLRAGWVARRRPTRSRRCRWGTIYGGRRGDHVSVECERGADCDFDLLHLLCRRDAYLLGHAALERALDQRRDRPTDAADMGCQE